MCLSHPLLLLCCSNITYDEDYSSQPGWQWMSATWCNLECSTKNHGKCIGLILSHDLLVSQWRGTPRHLETRPCSVISNDKSDLFWDIRRRLEMVSVYVVNKLLLSLVFNSPSTQHKILQCGVAYTFLHAVAKLLRASTLASKNARGSPL